MTLLSPWSLAWLSLLAPLVLLYVLKRRRARKVIGSTMLWELAQRDLRAERPWQRLRPHLSLLLQALVILLGSIALARPVGGGRVSAGARVAVVVDVSSSMATREQSGTRLSQALDLARARARDLPPGGTMMLVSASREPEILVPPTSDRARLERALDDLRVEGPGARLEAAVALAAERLRDAPTGSRILVMTDAAMAGEVPLGASVPVEVVRLGTDQLNHGILAVDVRASPTEARPDRADVFVRVARFGEGPGDVRVRAWSLGGDRARTELDARRLTLDAGEPSSLVMRVDLPPDPSTGPAFVQVSVEPVDTQDSFTLDDVAIAPSPSARRLSVFLVGEAPEPVRQVLLADREVELYATTLDALADRDDDEPPLEGLFVYARAVPDRAPVGDSLVVAPTVDEVFGVSLGAAIARPRIVSWAEADERMRFVRFPGVHLGAVRPITAATAHPLLTTDHGVAIGAVTRPDGETTIVAFDPAAGDWATRPGFVVFFRNLLERARRHRATGGIGPGPLGAPLRVPAPDNTDVHVQTPSGRHVEARSRGGVAIVEVPAEPGLFTAAVGSRRLFAVRLLADAEESDLRARAVFSRVQGSEGVATVEPVEHQEAWPWLVGGLLLLLLIEAVAGTREGAT